MFHNAHGCAAHAVFIRRNAFLAIFTSMVWIFLNFKILKFSYQAFVLHLISPMKVKLCWSVEHNASKHRLEKCQFNISSNGIHSVLDTPDLWANSVVYVTVEFPRPPSNKLAPQLLQIWPVFAIYFVMIHSIILKFCQNWNVLIVYTLQLLDSHLGFLIIDITWVQTTPGTLFQCRINWPPGCFCNFISRFHLSNFYNQEQITSRIDLRRNVWFTSLFVEMSFTIFDYFFQA